MAKKWHEYVTTRNRLITGGFLVLVGVISGGFALLGRGEPNITVSTTGDGPTVVSTGSGPVNVGIPEAETYTRSKRITEQLSTLSEVRTILVTVLDMSENPLSGIYLNRIIPGVIKTEPLEYSTDSWGQRYIQVRNGDRICTQKTDAFRSECRTVEPDTKEIRLMLERR